MRSVMHLGAIAIFLAVLATPLCAEVQPPLGKTTRIGYLSLRSGSSELDEAFRQGLRELGYVEGQHLAIEHRYADFKPDRAAALAAELVRLKVDVIVAVGGPIPTTAAKRATDTIPIVFIAGDPVGAGLVASLRRPGGNLTGLDNFTGELNVKRLELLKEMMPRVSRVTVLANPTNPQHVKRLKQLDGAARALRVDLHVREVRERNQIDDAFTAMAGEQTKALLVLTDPLFNAHRELLGHLTAKHRLPAVCFFREFAEAGGLLSYAPSFTDLYRRLATYVDRILKGAKPGDLPIEQPTKFEFVVNMRTARALGLTIPQTVLLRADLVIE